MVGKNLSHYKILEELGRGGMGIVYMAEDTKLDRTVAIKVLPSAALASEDDRARFYREAKAAAQLHHPHIASVFEIDEAVPEGSKDDDLRPFIAMEYIEGKTLDDKIKEGPFKLEDAVRIASEIASALEAAHKKDIVHRDIKSQNVMLTEEASAKVLDFGLAKTAQSTKLTRMGSTLGTIAYMSPEQARGEEVDARTDIWALGVTMYELITGRHPFGGDYEQAVVYSILNEEPEPLTSLRTGVPMRLEWIVNKCIAKQAKYRYQSVSELIVDLQTVDLSQLDLRRTSSLTTGKKGSHFTNKYEFALRAILLIAGLIFGSWAVWTWSPTNSPMPTRVYEAYFSDKTSIFWPTNSGNGRFIAFSAYDSLGLNPSLVVRDMMTGEMRIIHESRAIGQAEFSDDESKISFRSADRLLIADLPLGVPIEVDSPVYGQSVWGPDGSLYYTRRGDPDKIRIRYPDGTIDSLSISGEQVDNLTLDSVLPGGRFLIGSSGSISSDWSVVSVDLESGAVKTVLNERGFSASFVSPDYLVVQSSPQGGVDVYRFSTDDMRVVGIHKNLFGPRDFRSWAVTQSGHLVFTPSPLGRKLYTVSRSGQMTLLLNETADFDDFQLSPSGRQLAVEINNYDANGDQVVIYNLEDGTKNQITFDFPSFEPTWSSDEKEIVFVQSASAQELIKLRLDDLADVQSVTNHSGVSGHPHWSPNNQYIVYSTAAAGAGQIGAIWLYSFLTDTTREIVPLRSGEGYPRFSPDSKKVTFHSDRSGRNEVWIYDMESEEVYKVTDSGGSLPVWGPEGRTIYYKNLTSLMSVNVPSQASMEPSQPTEVANIESEFLFDVGRNGQIVVAALVSGPIPLINIHQNWAQSLEKE